MGKRNRDLTVFEETPTEENTAPDSEAMDVATFTGEAEAPVDAEATPEAPAEAAPEAEAPEAPAEEAPAPEAAPEADVPTQGDVTATPTVLGEDQGAADPAANLDAPFAEINAPEDGVPETFPEGDNAPLDPSASAPSDASPAPEATDGQAGAGAQGTTESKSGKELAGDKGAGATHAGTDTPEVMISHPCDPVTGRPLDGNTGNAKAYVVGGGDGPAGMSPSGHVMPGSAPEDADPLEGGESGSAEGDDSDSTEAEGGSYFGEAEGDEFNEGEEELESASSFDELVSRANRIVDLAMALAEDLSGFEES